jgi:hypothetical protein
MALAMPEKSASTAIRVAVSGRLVLPGPVPCGMAADKLNAGLTNVLAGLHTGGLKKRKTHRVMWTLLT